MQLNTHTKKMKALVSFSLRLCNRKKVLELHNNSKSFSLRFDEVENCIFLHNSVTSKKTVLSLSLNSIFKRVTKHLKNFLWSLFFTFFFAFFWVRCSLASHSIWIRFCSESNKLNNLMMWKHYSSLKINVG